MELVILHVNSNRKHHKKRQKRVQLKREWESEDLKQSWLTYQQHSLAVMMRRESLESRFYKKNNDTNDQNKMRMTIKTIFPGVDLILNYVILWMLCEILRKNSEHGLVFRRYIDEKNQVPSLSVATILFHFLSMYFNHFPKSSNEFSFDALQTTITTSKWWFISKKFKS